MLQNTCVYEAYDEAGVDFSISTNPLGMPKGAQKAAQESIAMCHLYPDGSCTQLREVFAKKMGILPSQAVFTAGADDAFYRMAFALAPKRAMVVVPTYEDYETALHQAGCAVERYYLHAQNRFALTDAILKHIHPQLDWLVLCNPNNPTGQLYAPQLVARIASMCEKMGALLIIDECFNGFLPNAEEYSARRLIKQNRHVFILGAFTKLYALSGLRLGYCISQNALALAKIQAAGQAWGVSIPAQAAGVACLQDADYLKKTHALLQAERTYLTQNLTRLGLEIWGDCANFLFFKSGYPHLREALAAQHMYLRDCSQFAGLGNGFCRCAIKNSEENIKFVQALQKLLQI